MLFTNEVCHQLSYQKWTQNYCSVDGRDNLTLLEKNLGNIAKIAIKEHKFHPYDFFEKLLKTRDNVF